MGEQLALMVNLLKDLRATSCDNTARTSSLAKRNADHLDDLEQCSLLSSISINIQDQMLKTRVGLKEDSDYNNIGVVLLLDADLELSS